MANILDLIGRIFISALFLISAYNKILNIDGSISWMEGYGVPGFLLYPTIILEIILPVFVIIGYNARISAGLLSIFCIVTAFLFHFDFSDQEEIISFFKNFFFVNTFYNYCYFTNNFLTFEELYNIINIIPNMFFKSLC